MLELLIKLVVLLTIILYVLGKLLGIKEGFDDRYWLGTHTNFLWNNVQIGRKSNMSYLMEL